MRMRQLSFLLVLATFGVSAQESEGDVRFGATGDGGQVSYRGDTNRVSVGVDDDGDFYGEFLHVFAEQATTNWIGEGWIGQDGRGGLKVNYHWLPGDLTEDDLLQRESLPGIRKLFLAADQNEFDDRKVSLGFGYENPRLFWSSYVTHAISGERSLGSRTSIFTDQITGEQDGRPFFQDRTIETITQFFAHPYDYGLGVRLGSFLENPLLRVRAGLDIEKGDFGSDQTTLSLGLEKFFRNSGHSLRLDLEHAEKDGDFETDENDTRAILFWRYQFGSRSNFAPAIDYRERAVSVAQPAVAAQPERRLVKNRISVEDIVLFAFDRSDLQPEALAALQKVVEQIKTLELAGPILVTGHTCDLGSTEYNEGLSQRRATSVERFLTSSSVSMDQIQTRAAGENEPRVPNSSEENRQRNRRTEIEFVTVEDDYEDILVAPAAPAKGIEWEREPVKDPAWVKRALRNPVQHKRTVDFYRYQREQVSETLGPVVFLNTAPAATDDQYTVAQNSAGNALSVLGNDSDVDNDTLTITSVSSPANGSATISGSTILYTPNSEFIGTDTFTYTVSDGEETATATVTVNVINGPPVAADDALIGTRGQTTQLDVLANDSDPEGDALTIVAVTMPTSGTAFIDGNRIGYTPAPGFMGTDTFTYTISDGNGNESVATVTVTVDNDAPIAVDDEARTSKDVAVVIDVLANDSDPNGDALTIASVSAEDTGFGDVEILPDNTILYTPHPGWWGGDTFDYTISDGFGGTDTATVTLKITEFR